MTRRSVLWPVAVFVLALSAPSVAALAEDASVLVASAPAVGAASAGFSQPIMPSMRAMYA